MMASTAKSTNNSETLKFVSGLKSHNEETRVSTAYDLQRYASTELREVSIEELTLFLEEFNHYIKEMVSSNDMNEKKGGIYAIMSLVDVDVGQTGQRVGRFANYLETLLSSTDVGVLELTAKAVGRLYLASGTYVTDFVEGLFKRSFEWLQEDKTESRKLAAVLVLRELAQSVPTYFFQRVQQFFDVIFKAVRDSKPAIREGAVAAIRVALSVTAQRETKETQQPIWYSQCIDQVYEGFNDSTIMKDRSISKDDAIHGSLLLLNELLRCSNSNWEKQYNDLRHLTHYQASFPQKKERGSVVTRCLRGHGSMFAPAAPHLHDLLSSHSAPSPITGLETSFYLPCESRSCKETLLKEYHCLCSLLLNQKSSRNSHIQSSLLQIIPRMAALNKDLFSAKGHLRNFVTFLITSMRTKDREKSSYFVALGLLAVAMGDIITKYLPDILTVCKANLPNKDYTSKKKVVDHSVCVCISLVAKAIGPFVHKDIDDLLEPMMAGGLSPSLTISLQTLSSDIPSLKKNIAEGLLKMLGQILIQRNSYSQGGKSMSTIQSYSPEHQGMANIVLALRTLGTFDFEGTDQCLMPFIKHICNNYLTNEQKEIRLEAIPTCLHLLKPTYASMKSKRDSLQLSSIFSIVSKILWVCVSDTDSDVRLCALTSFDETFDGHLSQSENINAFIYAASDERFEIREQSLCTLGRLSMKNTSFIQPELRKMVLKILDELEYSGVGRNRELNARVLGHLIASAPQFMKYFVEAIMGVLFPKLKEQDPNPSVTMYILTAIGDLAQVSGTEMRGWLNELLPFLLEMLGDGTSGWKRQVSLVTLGRLVENAGYIEHPYSKYPALLDVLLSFLKTEQQAVVRRDTLRLLGLLGALDPYKYKMNTGLIKIQQDTGVPLICVTDNRIEDTSEMTASEMLVNMNYSQLEEFYPACAIVVLMKVIKDPTLVQHQNSVVRAVTFIFQSLELKEGIPYLPKVIPSFLHVIRTSDATFRDFLFKQLSAIINIVKHHIRNYLDSIISVLKEFWQTGGKFENTVTIIAVVESIALAVGSDLRVYLKDLIPLISKTFANDFKESVVTEKLLRAIQQFGVNLEEYLHMILPPVIRLFDAMDLPMDVRKTAIETVNHLSTYLDLSDHVSQIIHPLIRILDSTPELRPCGLDLLCSLATQLGQLYDTFVPTVQKVLNKHKITHQRYDILVGKIVKGLPITNDEMEIMKGPQPVRSTFPEPRISKKSYYVNKDALQRAWSFKRLISKDDWLEWLRKLGIELMKSSPSHALRACYQVATTYVQLSRDLFNVAFVSCWCELDELLQNDLQKCLEHALTKQDIPEITQTLLNLAEFMEHCDKRLPLDLQLLGRKALECRAYAKALHYKEEEFHKGPSNEILETLISINNKLGQTEASAGLIEFSKNHPTDMKVQERWFEKLHDWDRALEAYEVKLKESPDDPDLTLGQMRCLEALGEWGELYSVANEHWDTFELHNECRRQMARLSAAAAWVMGKWDTMQKYTNIIPRETQEGSFYRAVLAIHNNQFSLAQEYITISRDLLDTDLTAMVGESYQRAYNSMVAVQMLAELEEVIQYKCIPDRRKGITQLWWQRLQGCQQDVEDWQKILQVRSLVLTPQESTKVWLKFAAMCRKVGRLSLARETLVTLMGHDPDDGPTLSGVIPQVTYQYCKYLYTCKGKESEAFGQLQAFLQYLTPIVQESPNGSESLYKLISRVHLKLGLWYQELHSPSEKSLGTVLSYMKHSKEADPNCYKAWHAFACTSFEAISLYRNKIEEINQRISESSEDDSDSTSDRTNLHRLSNIVTEFAISACDGFARSINLSGSKNTLQDTLRLLTVCFEHGSQPAVNKILEDRLKTIQIDNWLQVIPQLIARIDTTEKLVNNVIQSLLVNVGKQHPQALLYPLTVAAKSSETSRMKAADIVIQSMREHSNEQINQAMMISDELIRVAILWHEKWYEGLEEACRLYYTENDVPGMFRVLKPLHNLIEHGPDTLKEMSFKQTYGRELEEASQLCRAYQTSNNTRDLNQAWELYYQVFRRISKQLPLLTSLDLKAVSPKLHMCKDLDIAVPGSYIPNAPINKISCIKANIQVLTSKQKPRKLCIRGSDGHDYVFILKGHEDLRQDERVMQLFGLVNTLLINNPETFRRNLTIQRYAVIPLSTNSGLIGWVPNCDTLHVLIRDWRERRKILLTIEHRIMLRMTQDFGNLCLMQKVEVFEHALANTVGDDLAKLLWLKSPSSEVWFDRRTNYIRSLAVMSMVGYVLGLGDRHPSNLMLHQLTGKIVHIDFGDCFEVAMAREKFPEKIPFRLTRMLINAMEVTGIEGTYRMTCESVLSLLRSNRDSLMAILEAFVYDPLLNWRLLEKDRKKSLDDDLRDVDGEDVLKLTREAAMKRGPPQPGPSNAPTGGAAAVPDTHCSPVSVHDKRASEAANKKAVTVIKRVKDKLTGKDFGSDETLDVHRQVDLLIEQATDHENLCQCYIGWCPFW